MVGAWQASGVSMRAYAQHVRIHGRWFSLWRRRRAPQEGTAADSHVAPVAVGEQRGLADGNGLGACPG